MSPELADALRATDEYQMALMGCAPDRDALALALEAARARWHQQRGARALSQIDWD